MIRLDTHVVVWLFTGEIERLSEGAIASIDTTIPTISPIVQLELTYLHEIGRLSVGGADVVADLRDRIGLHMSDASMAAVVNAAAAVNWTRDPFDRMIVADAQVSGAELLTKDRVILGNTPIASW